MNTCLFESIARTHAAAEVAMLEAQFQRFPHHSVIAVAHDRYSGPGIVVIEDSTPVGQLAVRLENGNVWCYPALCCKPIPRSEWPLWAKRQLRKWAQLHRKNMDAIMPPSGALKL